MKRISNAVTSLQSGFARSKRLLAVLIVAVVLAPTAVRADGIGDILSLFHTITSTLQGPIGGALSEMRKLSTEMNNFRQQIIWPLALIYYSETVNIVAWCELRQALRNFRADRVRESRPLDAFFRGHGERLRREWVADWARDRAAERERTD